MEFHGVKIEIRCFTTEEGGRKNGVLSGYRGQFYYDGNDYDWFQFFPDQSEEEMAELGVTVHALIRFPQSRCDQFHSKRIFVGMEFEIHEGAKVVGRGTVKRV